MTEPPDDADRIGPELLQRHVPHPPMPDWDARRIADARAAYLERAKHCFADRVLSGAELLAELDRDG